MESFEALILKNIPNYYNLLGSDVIIENPLFTIIDSNAVIGTGTIVKAGSRITGETKIGIDCVIGPDARIEKCFIGDGVTIVDSTLIESSVGDDSKVGPYSYLRPNSHLGKKVKIGDFVEVKNSNIGDGSKVSHLTYVGDADVGKNVNVGCGVVFVNYDGNKKSRSVVEDNAFIGCNTNLVAPVTVHEGAYTAAGTTVTADVSKDALAVGRARQKQIDNWAIKHREKKLTKN